MASPTYISLEKFLMRLAFEKGLIRKNKGNSIVPLALVYFGDPSDENLYYTPYRGLHLATVSQKTGGIYINRDLSKKYSATGHMYGRYRFLGVRSPSYLRKEPLITVNAVYLPEPEDIYEN